MGSQFALRTNRVAVVFPFASIALCIDLEHWSFFFTGIDLLFPLINGHGDIFVAQGERR